MILLFNLVLIMIFMRSSRAFKLRRLTSLSIRANRNYYSTKRIILQNQERPVDSEEKVSPLKETLTSILNFFFPMQLVSKKLDNFASLVMIRFDSTDERFDGIDERLDGIDERLDGIDKSMITAKKENGMTRELSIRNQLTTAYSQDYSRRTNVVGLNSLIDLFGTKIYQQFEDDSKDPLEIISKRRQLVARKFLVRKIHIA